MTVTSSHFANIYSLEVSSRNWSDTHGYILKVPVFSDFFYKETLTSLISFSSKNTFYTQTVP